MHLLSRERHNQAHSPLREAGRVGAGITWLLSGYGPVFDEVCPARAVSSPGYGLVQGTVFLILFPEGKWTM